SATRRSMRWKAPTRWSWSPSGSSSAARISRASARRWATRWCSTAATCTTRARSRRPDWPITASAGGAPCMSDLLPSAREQALEERLVELEMRVSFQEHALAELSEALADARMQGSRNADVLRVLLEDLGKVRNALNASDPASEPPPPHY